MPCAVAGAARLAASCLPEVLSEMERDLRSLELRGVSDIHDSSTVHLFQIGALIAAAQRMKESDGSRWGSEGARVEVDQACDCAAKRNA